MAKSILDHKKLLIVDDEPDSIAVVEEEILESCPNAKIDKANDYESAAALLKTKGYDLVILDSMGMYGSELLEMAVKRNLKVVMLTAYTLNPEILEKSRDMGASAYLPKDKLGELVPFLEDVLWNDYKSGWKRFWRKVTVVYEAKYSADWKKTGYY